MMLEAVLGIAFLVLLGLVLLLNVVSLPANWIIAALVIMWKLINPAPGDMGAGFFTLLIGAAAAGEVIEFLAQAWGAKKYGATTGGMWAGVAGALVGAFLGLPFLLGLGALLGALCGAWLGSYLLERLRGRPQTEALRAAKGALLGRFLGLVIKCALGAFMIGLVYRALWADAASAVLVV